MNGGTVAGTRPLTSLLIRTRIRCARNYVRHHFDRGTIVRLVLLAGLLVAGVSPSFNAIMDAPAAKAPWNPLPGILLCAALSIPWGLRRETGSQWAVYALLPIPRQSLANYDLAHRLALPVLLAVVFSLTDFARAIVHPSWWLRAALEFAAFLFAGTAGVAIAALWPRRARGIPVPVARPGAAAWAGLVLPGRGAVRELIRLDALFLVRRRRGVLPGAAGAAILAAVAAFRATSPAQGMTLVILIQGISALLFINQLLGLFEKDLLTIDRIKALPVSGSDIWRSRWIVAAILSILPGIAGAAALGARFGITAAWLPVPAAVLLIVVTSATLYANVGLGLFPRFQLMGLFLNLAVVLPATVWFLAPPVSVVLLTLALFFGYRSAVRAFDRLEIS